MNCEYSGNIPSYNEYSSLNSLLMASLYSENSRDLIIKKSKKWNSSNKYKSLVKKIVNKNKRKKDISDDISLLNPDEIFLDNMFFLKERKNKSSFGNDLKTLKINKIHWIDDFIVDFYRSLELSCLDIYILNDKHYLNIYKFINWKLTEDNYTTGLNENIILTKKEHFIPENPDVLIVFHDKLNNSINNKYITPIESYSKSPSKNLLELFNNNEINNFINIEEEVLFGNDTYILDSILLRIGNKSIVGFRCDGEKYVYNNFSSTYDNTCSVIKFDWKYNEGEFCYNPIKCMLEDEEMKDINDLCFNFNSGDKTLIYIKKDKKNDIPDIPDIPDSDILKIIKDIKNMTIPILVDNVKKYNPEIVINSTPPKEELEKNLLKYYMINYLSIYKNEPATEPEP